MKKIKYLMILFYFIGNICYAQSGFIDSITIFPSNPTEVDSIYIIADLSFDRANCSLFNSYSIPSQDSILLHASYCLGNITSNCSSTDTFNLGAFAAGTYSLDFHLSVRPIICNGPANTVDYSFNNSFTVALYTGKSSINEKHNFSVFPNPSNNSIVNLKSDSSYPYNLICYNGLGQEVFELAGLTGNHTINLPKENGIYFIKIVDHQNQTSILKCLNQQN